MSVHSSETLVILTATIEPKVTPSLVRVDFGARRSDYLASVAHYSASLPPDKFKLLLVENSGADVADLLAVGRLHGHDIETISYDEEYDVQARGKGNGEALILDRAVSWNESRNEQYPRIAKVTGRLRVRNIAEILQTPTPARFVSCRIRFDRTQADTRLLVADKKTWSSFLSGMEPFVKEASGVYLEHVVALRLAQGVFEGVTWAPIRPTPDIRGVSGSTGVAYGGRRERVLDQLSRLSAGLLAKHYL